jgi:CBS domain-containing protein
MFDEPVRKVMERQRMLTASPDADVRATARRMAEAMVGAVMVVEDRRLVGIFTERDALFRVIAAGRDSSRTTLGEVMTRDPHTVTPEETFGYSLLLMHEHGFRHVPVVEAGVPVGMVSARDALDPDLEEFESEAQRRRAIRRVARTAAAPSPTHAA